MDVSTEYAIKRLVVSGNSEKIKVFLLNDNQINLLNFIRKKNGGHVTAAEIKEKYNCSIQNASSKLKRLYEAKYIDRVDVGSKSGGTEYGYFVRTVKAI